LNQVQLAIQKGSLGEFTWFRLARAKLATVTNERYE
jgi:hypothetical protein